MDPVIVVVVVVIVEIIFPLVVVVIANVVVVPFPDVEAIKVPDETKQTHLVLIIIWCLIVPFEPEEFLPLALLLGDGRGHCDTQTPVNRQHSLEGRARDTVPQTTQVNTPARWSLMAN